MRNLKYLFFRFLFYLKKSESKMLFEKIFISIFKDHKIKLDNLKLSKELSLDQLFNKFGTDNGSLDTKKTFFSLRKKNEFFKRFQNYEKWINRSDSDISEFEYQSGANYAPYFDKHLKKIKNENLNFLEIGTGSGHAVASFYFYLPFAKFYCIDKKPESMFMYSSKRIFYKSLNIYDNQKVKNYLMLNNSFDFILEDSDHNQESILTNFKNFYPRLNNNGIYCIKGFSSQDNFLKHVFEFNNKNNTKVFHPVENNTIKEIFDCVKEKTFFENSIIDKKFLENLYTFNNEINFYYTGHPAGGLLFLKKSYLD